MLSERSIDLRNNEIRLHAFITRIALLGSSKQERKNSVSTFLFLNDDKKKDLFGDLSRIQREKLITGLKNYIRKDEEIGLLNSTSLPVYKMLNVQATFQKDKSIMNVSAYADVIAMDILFQYLQTYGHQRPISFTGTAV